MRHPLIAVFATAFLFAACSNNSTSSADDAIDYSHSLDTMGVATVFETPSSYTASKTEHRLTINREAKTLDACVAEGNNYSWKTITVTDGPLDYWYEFLGDTLVLYRIYTDEEYDLSSNPNWEDRDYGAMFVGGKGGELEGTWDYTGCEYSTESQGVECFSPLDEHTASSLKITKNSATIIKRHFFEKYLDEIEAVGGYVNVLMVDIYDALANTHGRDAGVGSYWELYTRGVEQSQQEATLYGVEAIDSTENSKTFIIGDKTYTFKVIKAGQSLNQYNNIFMDINVEVSDGTTTCVGYFKTQFNEKSQCNAEGYKNSYKEVGYDSNGDTVHYAYEYQHDNEDEFNKCLDGIAAKTYDSELENLKDSERD